MEEAQVSIPSDQLAHLIHDSHRPLALDVTAKLLPWPTDRVGAYQRRRGYATFHRVPTEIAEAIEPGDFVATAPEIEAARGTNVCPPVFEVLPLDADEDAPQIKQQEDGDGSWRYLKTIFARDTGQKRSEEQRNAFLAAERDRREFEQRLANVAV